MDRHDLPQRTERALERDPDVLKVSDDLFLVESSGNRSDSEWYQVDLGGWSCQCPDYEMRGEKCYHLRAAIIKHANGNFKEV